MIVLTRVLARQFRALARKCVSGRPRGPAPPVVMEARGGMLTVFVQTPDALLTHTSPTTVDDGLIVVPMGVLEQIEGGTSDPVELSVRPKLAGRASWTVHGEPQSMEFAALLPGKMHTLPVPPERWHDVPASFLDALFECGRTACREPGRYAIHRIQLRGKAGQVIGTDGKQALLWGGFRLPVGGDRLVPALPVFGARELAGATGVRIGTTDTHLVVGVGPWSVWLPVDSAGRYPDVAGVMPRPGRGTVVGIDEADAIVLRDVLPKPTDGDDPPTVTFDLDRGVRVRVRDETAVREVSLVRSTATGQQVQVAVESVPLGRALALGLLTMRVCEAGKPIAFEDGPRTFLALALDESRVIPRNENPDPMPTTPPKPALPAGERSIPMKAHETNGHANGNGRHDPPASEPPDLLGEAEALRNLLSEASVRAGRLATALRQNRRQKKQLETVMAGLRQLNLGS